MLVLAPGAVLDEAAARAAVRAQLGDGMRIRIEQVSSIPRTLNGKLRVVVRALPVIEAERHDT